MSLYDVRYVSDYLASIANQTYNKNRLHFFIDCTQLPADGHALVADFLSRHRTNYASVAVYCSSTQDPRQDALNYARFNETHYFATDQNAILHPATLRRLHRYGLDVVAPMLIGDGVYSNFHAAVTDTGYFQGSDRYFHILNRDTRGIHDVPVVNGCYLIRHDRLKHVKYHDDSGRLDYVVFSEGLRRASIPQYVDNTVNYGILVNYTEKASDEITEAHRINNRSFYLNIGKSQKKAIICDADWLSTYVVAEHFYFFKILQQEYGFHIVNCNRMDFDAISVMNDLNSYDFILLAYHFDVKVRLDLISSYKVYKIDDLENEPRRTRLARFNIKHSDMVISPYAYVFDNYFRHDNVQWVPYSCALEAFDDHETIRFNDDPKLKVLQLGHVGWSYPFRQYVAELDHPKVEHLSHPGWNHADSSQAMIKLRYYHHLNQYICCFTDALIYRYIVAKNFEIPAVGALLLTDKLIEREMNQLGFIDYKTCIFCDKDTFLDKVEWILDPANRGQVDEIRLAGMKLVRENHMTSNRAAQFVKLVSSKMG